MKFGILTFISRINTKSENFKARKNFFYRFSFYEQLKFHAKLSSAQKKFYNLEACSGSTQFASTVLLVNYVSKHTRYATDDISRQYF